MRMPSFLKGVSRLCDSYGNLDQYKVYKNEDESDREAIKRDWIMVGRDIANAIKKYGTKRG